MEKIYFSISSTTFSYLPSYCTLPSVSPCLYIQSLLLAAWKEEGLSAMSRDSKQHDEGRMGIRHSVAWLMPAGK